MPEELDPTTARLVSELAASILPALSKSLTSAIPANDFTGAVERSNRITQDLRSGVEKAVRSAIDDSRAGRSMIIQSIGTVLEEISSLRRMLEKVPGMLETAIKNTRPDENITGNTSNEALRNDLMNELSGISERINTLTQGIKAFFETYAEHREQNISVLPELLQPGVDSEAISGLEGLIRAEGKSHSKELAELSREISTMHEENNAALLHEVREAVAEELSGITGGEYSGHSGHDGGNVKLLKITAGLSGACLVLLLINMIMMMFK